MYMGLVWPPVVAGKAERKTKKGEKEERERGARTRCKPSRDDMKRFSSWSRRCYQKLNMP